MSWQHAAKKRYSCSLDSCVFGSTVVRLESGADADADVDERRCDDEDGEDVNTAL